MKISGNAIAAITKSFQKYCEIISDDIVWNICYFEDKEKYYKEIAICLYQAFGTLPDILPPLSVRSDGSYLIDAVMTIQKPEHLVHIVHDRLQMNDPQYILPFDRALYTAFCTMHARCCQSLVEHIKEYPDANKILSCFKKYDVCNNLIVRTQASLDTYNNLQEIKNFEKFYTQTSASFLIGFELSFDEDTTDFFLTSQVERNSFYGPSAFERFFSYPTTVMKNPVSFENFIYEKIKSSISGK